MGRQLLQVKTSHVKSSNTAHYSGLCPQIPGFPVALGPDSPLPHSKSRAIPTSLHIVIVSLGALKYWGKHIFKCQAPLGLTAHVLMPLPGASPWGSGKLGSHGSHMKEAHALATLEAAWMSDLCRHVSVHILPFHHILVHDSNGSGTSHSLLRLTLLFSESLEH